MAAGTEECFYLLVLNCWSVKLCNLGGEHDLAREMRLFCWVIFFFSNGPEPTD